MICHSLLCTCRQATSATCTRQQRRKKRETSLINIRDNLSHRVRAFCFIFTLLFCPLQLVSNHLTCWLFVMKSLQAGKKPNESIRTQIHVQIERTPMPRQTSAATLKQDPTLVYRKHAFYNILTILGAALFPYSISLSYWALVHTKASTQIID